MLRAVHFFNLKRHTCTGSHPHASCLHIWGQTETTPRGNIPGKNQPRPHGGTSSSPRAQGSRASGCEEALATRSTVCPHSPQTWRRVTVKATLLSKRRLQEKVCLRAGLAMSRIWE